MLFFMDVIMRDIPFRRHVGADGTAGDQPPSLVAGQDNRAHVRDDSLVYYQAGGGTLCAKRRGT